MFGTPLVSDLEPWPGHLELAKKPYAAYLAFFQGKHGFGDYQKAAVEIVVFVQVVQDKRILSSHHGIKLHLMFLDECRCSPIISRML